MNEDELLSSCVSFPIQNEKNCEICTKHFKKNGRKANSQFFKNKSISDISEGYGYDENLIKRFLKSKFSYYYVELNKLHKKIPNKVKYYNLVEKSNDNFIVTLIINEKYLPLCKNIIYSKKITNLEELLTTIMTIGNYHVYKTNIKVCQCTHIKNYLLLKHKIPIFKYKFGLCQIYWTGRQCTYNTLTGITNHPIILKNNKKIFYPECFGRYTLSKYQRVIRYQHRADLKKLYPILKYLFIQD